MDNSMAYGLMIFFGLSILMLMVRGLKNALPPAISRAWTGIGIVILILVATRQTALIEQCGLNPHSAIHGVILCVLLLGVLEKMFGRLLEWP